MPIRYQVIGPLQSGEGSRASLGMRIEPDGQAHPAVFVWVPETVLLTAEKLQTLQAETARAKQLVHPNITRVYGLAELEGGLARVVDFTDGETLRTVLNAVKRLPPPFAARIVADAAMGVHYAHLAGNDDGTPLVHGDLRPETLMIALNGISRVAGYGALSVAPKEPKGKRVVGRRLYCAPEQVRAGRSAATVQSDVFLLGLMLYECLTGKRPYARRPDLDVAVVSEPLPPVYLPNVPDGLNHVLSRATAKKPEERYPNALVFREELELAMGELASHELFAAYLLNFFPDVVPPHLLRRHQLEVKRAHLAAPPVVVPPPPRPEAEPLQAAGVRTPLEMPAVRGPTQTPLETPAVRAPQPAPSKERRPEPAPERSPASPPVPPPSASVAPPSVVAAPGKVTVVTFPAPARRASSRSEGTAEHRAPEVSERAEAPRPPTPPGEAVAEAYLAGEADASKTPVPQGEPLPPRAPLGATPIGRVQLIHHEPPATERDTPPLRRSARAAQQAALRAEERQLSEHEHEDDSDSDSDSEMDPSLYQRPPRQIPWGWMATAFVVTLVLLGVGSQGRAALARVDRPAPSPVVDDDGPLLATGASDGVVTAKLQAMPAKGAMPSAPAAQLPVVPAMAARAALTSAPALTLASAKLPAAGSGSYSLTTEPAAVEVLISGKSRGRTPITLALAPGKYKLQLRDDRHAINTFRTITVGDGNPPAQAFKLAQGSFALKAPPSSHSMVDGRPLGDGSFSASLYEGYHHIVVRFGKDRWEEDFRVDPNDKVELEAYFDPPSALDKGMGDASGG